MEDSGQYKPKKSIKYIQKCINRKRCYKEKQ